MLVLVLVHLRGEQLLRGVFAHHLCHGCGLVVLEIRPAWGVWRRADVVEIREVEVEYRNS